MVESSEVENLLTAANELNNLLQQISGYANRSEILAREQPELHHFIVNLIRCTHLVSKVTETILGRSGFTEQSKLNRMLASGLSGLIAKPYLSRFGM